MSAPFGSTAWAARNEGRLSVGERIVEIFHGATALTIDRSARLGHRLGMRPRAMRMALAEIPVPRTPVVAAAEAALAPADPWVLGHSMRTYLFGAVLGVRDGVRADADVLLLASLLHDIGLVHRDGAACFAYRGATRARSIVTGAGGDATVAERVAEAISTHLNVRTVATSAEARLVRAGAGFDVVGDRFEHVDRETRRDVVAAWPREGFAKPLRAVLGDEAAKHPGTRIAFLCHGLGFLRLIAQADRRFAGDERTRPG